MNNTFRPTGNVHRSKSFKAVMKEIEAMVRTLPDKISSNRKQLKESFEILLKEQRETNLRIEKLEAPILDVKRRQEEVQNENFKLKNIGNDFIGFYSDMQSLHSKMLQYNQSFRLGIGKVPDSIMEEMKESLEYYKKSYETVYIMNENESNNVVLTQTSQMIKSSSLSLVPVVTKPLLRYCLLFNNSLPQEIVEQVKTSMDEKLSKCYDVHSALLDLHQQAEILPESSILIYCMRCDNRVNHNGDERYKQLCDQNSCCTLLVFQPNKNLCSLQKTTLNIPQFSYQYIEFVTL